MKTWRNSVLAMALIVGLAACSSGTKSDSPSTRAATSAPAKPATLEGTWTTGAVTCDQQHRASMNGGFPDELWQGWGCTKPMTFTIKLLGGHLVEFENGDVGWNGLYEDKGDGTFVAGDNGTMYITYRYAIDGDQLTVDVTRDDFPGSHPGEPNGDFQAQTVIYESVPFTRVT